MRENAGDGSQGVVFRVLDQAEAISVHLPGRIIGDLDTVPGPISGKNHIPNTAAVRASDFSLNSKRQRIQTAERKLDAGITLSMRAVRQRGRAPSPAPRARLSP